MPRGRRPSEIDRSGRIMWRPWVGTTSRHCSSTGTAVGCGQGSPLWPRRLGKGPGQQCAASMALKPAKDHEAPSREKDMDFIKGPREMAANEAEGQEGMRARSGEQFYLLHPGRWRGPANLPASKPVGGFKAGLHRTGPGSRAAGARPATGVPVKRRFSGCPRIPWLDEIAPSKAWERRMRCRKQL